MAIGKTENTLVFRDVPIHWVKDGLKISSIRVPRDGNNFESGQTITGIFDTGVLPIVILGNIDSPIARMPGGLLLGDGFTSVQSAEDTLVQAYAGSGTPVHSGQNMRGILFTSSQRMERFDPIDRMFLKRAGKTNLQDLLYFTQDVKENSKFRSFLFNSWAFWALDFHKLMPEKYPDLLLSLGIISPDVNDSMLKTLASIRNVRQKSEKENIMHDFRKGY